MAGHSQFKNIMYRKGAQDAKRAKRFAKLVREVIIAAKQGMPDSEHNPRLRLAIAAAHRAGPIAPELAQLLPYCPVNPAPNRKGENSSAQTMWLRYVAPQHVV